MSHDSLDLNPELSPLVKIKNHGPNTNHAPQVNPLIRNQPDMSNL